MPEEIFLFIQITDAQIAIQSNAHLAQWQRHSTKDAASLGSTPRVSTMATQTIQELKSTLEFHGSLLTVTFKLHIDPEPGQRFAWNSIHIESLSGTLGTVSSKIDIPHIYLDDTVKDFVLDIISNYTEGRRALQKAIEQMEKPD